MQASSQRVKLQELVEWAEQLAEARGPYYTDGAHLALIDMIDEARKALEGAEKPFVRSREFLAPRDEEAILFATRRYTMTPSYLPEGQVHHEYGLEPALQWFEKQDMMHGGAERLRDRAHAAIGQAETALQAATWGEEVGSFDKAAGTRLEHAVEHAKEALSAHASAKVAGEPLALAVVQCLNRYREFRHSRRLRRNDESSANLYLSQEGMERLKETVRCDAALREQYERIVEISNRYTLEQIEQASSLMMTETIDYAHANEAFYLWSSTDKIVNFTTPEGAASASLSFILPSANNEREGLGHVWIDNVQILSAVGGILPLRNGGFDEGVDSPAHWQGEALRGFPVLRWEDRYPYCGGGDRSTVDRVNPSSQIDFDYAAGDQRRSIYIENPTADDEGAWSTAEDFEIAGDAGYTLTFAAKLDGKLRSGLKAVLRFKDERGELLEEFVYSFNRKSSLPNSCFLLTLQCDAIRYAMTGDMHYADKTKKEILYTLNDFCQGAEHWLVTNERPQGSDSYGAVQGGRVLCSVAVSYSLIRSANIFTAEEKKRFYALIDYMLRYMLDLRDRTELTMEEAQRGSSNWQTDMCAGTAMIMLALDDFPNRLIWLNNAHWVLESQLRLNVNADHSWPESIRYHHAALERFAGYARIARHMMGDNWFKTTPLGRMFGFSIQVQTPAYRYFDNRIGTPPFGDHVLGGGGEFACFGMYAGEMEEVDRELAEQMLETWRLADKPRKGFWGEAVAFDNLLTAGEMNGGCRLNLKSTNELAQAGIYVFRKGFGTGDESYLAIHSSPKPIGHGHLDQGSFILYKHSVPIVMDSGIEGYFDNSTSWHISSYSHACVQFAAKRQVTKSRSSGFINLTAGTFSLERGWVDVPRTSKVLYCEIEEEVERIAIEIKNGEGSGRHIRTLWHLVAPDLYVIRDEIEGFEGDVLFSLPVAARDSSIEGNRVYSEGAYGIDLETTFLSPVRKIWLEKGRAAPFFERSSDGSCMLDYVRATANSREGFLTVLHPKRRGACPLEAELEGETLWLTHEGKRFLCELGRP
ncbi:heparinase II/III family protein [Paenibacillus sp. HB172176]|uniref:heparinase II/III domain-containing protein n=1 Tax=Paenibacillus sp. HB172176 TaxID=2493690 RepID=UPI00143B5F8B|nr:heparinase II/III family protein [Paenibacillus sp. HB172176]